MADALSRFEALGALYYAETGYLRPGKSNPLETGRDSNDDENRERFEQWVTTRALTAALDQVVHLERCVEGLASRLDELETNNA